MKILRGLAVLVLVAIALLVAVGVAARFSDGPIGMFAGGPFTSGEWVDDPDVDWSFVRDVPEVELQLVEPPRSRITWILEHDGAAYVACGFINIPLWKQWPHEAMVDGRAILRVGGRRYPVEAMRVDDPALYATVAAEFAAKYPVAGGELTDPSNVWMFRLDHRDRDPS
jgi:hypothetical protein